MKHSGVFQTAFRRLAGLYAALAVVVTLSFTVPPLIAQRQAHDEVNHMRRTPQFIEQNIGPDLVVRIESYVSQRDEEFRQNLTLRILEINGFMLLLTIVASYFLARRSLQPLQETLDRQETFAAELAHELKTPLATALLELEEIKRTGGNLTGEQKKKLAELSRDIKEVGTLTEQTLALMAVEYTEQKSNFTHLDATAIITRVQKAVTAAARKKGLTVTVEPLPRATVLGNKTQLRQLFIILLDNAIKYTSKGGSITVEGRVSDGRLMVDVTDTGVGIAPDQHEKIFEKFYQGDGEARGSGLGLAIARRICETHGGSLQVQSILRRGSTFTVTLPVVT